MNPALRGLDATRLSVVAAATVAFALVGCAASLPPTVLVPTAEDGVKAETYFNQGAPFAVVRDSSGTLLAALEPAVVGSSTYLRLWYLVENDGDAPFEINPQHDFSLHLRMKSSGDVQKIEPETTTSILERLDQLRPARPSRRFERDVVARDEATGSWMEDYWLDTHRWDQRRTLLRRETVLMGSRVHGFAYFPVPMHFQEAAGDNEGWTRFTFKDKDTPTSNEDFDVSVRVTTPSGDRVLAFRPENSE